MQKASHIINALFLIIFSRRFTHVSLGSSHTHAYFGWASTWICMGPDLEIIFGGQKSEKISIFLLLHKLVRKGFPHHLHHFFRRKSINFTPIGAHFEACIVSFRCVCIRRARLIVICISFWGRFSSSPIYGSAQAGVSVWYDRYPLDMYTQYLTWDGVLMFCADILTLVVGPQFQATSKQASRMTFFVE